MNIYQITKEINELLNSLPETGEMDDEALALYAELQETAQDKLKATILFYKNLDSHTEAIDFEIKRLKALKEAKAKQKETIAKFIRYGMETTNQKSVDYGVCKAGFRKSTRVEVDEETLSKAFYKTKITEAVDKAGIKKLLKEGVPVEGAKLVQVNNLTIN